MKNSKPEAMISPKHEPILEQSIIIRADDDFVGGTVPTSSDLEGLTLWIMLGLDVSIVDCFVVGLLVGLSSIVGGGGTNLDIGNNEGYDEGFRCKWAQRIDN